MDDSNTPSPPGSGNMAEDSQAADSTHTRQEVGGHQEVGEHQEEVADYSLAGIGTRLYDQFITARQQDSGTNTPIPAHHLASPTQPMPQDQDVTDRSVERPNSSERIAAAINGIGPATVVRGERDDSREHQQQGTAAAKAASPVAAWSASLPVKKENEPPEKDKGHDSGVGGRAASIPSPDGDQKEYDAPDKHGSDAVAAAGPDNPDSSNTADVRDAPTRQTPTASHLPWPDIPGDVQPHAQTDAIVKQVEYFFCDENLHKDGHLLGRTGPAGNGWVWIQEILGWKTMRGYKPIDRVKASLKLSEALEVYEDSNWIRRKKPLGIAPIVAPKVNPKKDRDAKLAAQPWMTKGMLKPTGFETKNAPQEPVKKDEHEEKQKRWYDPEESLTARIDRAVAFFMAKRKFHQRPLHVFTKYLAFGGFSGSQSMFTGKIDEKQLPDHDKDDMILLKAEWGVAEKVVEGVAPVTGEPSWIVDFEGMVKSFFSIEFMSTFGWKDKEAVGEATNILRNFFNYLNVWDVCPEYKADIDDAIAATYLVEKEFPKLALVDSGMPGEFNKACSYLFGGYYAQFKPADPNAEWVPDDEKGAAVEVQHAKSVFEMGTIAHCTEEQLVALETIKNGHEQATVTEQEVGLEVTRIEFASGEAKDCYDHPDHKEVFKRSGLLHCTYWSVPQSRPGDVPKHALVAAEKALKAKPYKIIMDEKLLKNFQPGMKMEAIIKKFECGFIWLDAVERVYPTFFTWTFNGYAMNWKTPGPPKHSMLRAEGREPEGGEADGHPGGDEGAGEMDG